MAIENENQEPVAPQMDSGGGGTQSFIGGRPFANVVKGAGKSAGKSGNLLILIAFAVVVLGVGFFLVTSMPGKKKLLSGPRMKMAAPNNAQSMRQPENVASTLPNEQVNTAPQQQATGVTSAFLQATTRTSDADESAEGSEKSDNSNPIGHTGKSGSHAPNVGSIPDFQPPPVPGSSGQNGGQWTPPPYQAGALPGQSLQQVEELRRAAVVKSSLTVYVSDNEPGTIDKSSGSASRDAAEPITNFGYEPGYHLAAHLESVSTTAIAAPVIAVVDYDYRRNGVTIIPAGSRVIGRMSQSSGSTGIVAVSFSSIHLNNGMTVPISAIGLNTQLGPLKGIVTGRNTLKQILFAAVGGLGSTAAMFAGNTNVNGELTEADLMRQQAAQNIGSSVDNQISQLQVTENIVVTLPAGTPVEVFFTAATKSPAAK